MVLGKVQKVEGDSPWHIQFTEIEVCLFFFFLTLRHVENVMSTLNVLPLKIVHNRLFFFFLPF